ncbi:hypothetical protein V8F06_006092 [Rhypophila decipiens]
MGQNASTDSSNQTSCDKTSGSLRGFEREGDLKDFEAWKVCWEVNLAFYEPLRGKLTCLVCKKVHDYGQGINRSTLWMATRCGSGHGQGNIAVQPGTSLGICAKCDLDFLLNVLKGKYKCRREGCRRMIRVNEGVVFKRLNKSQTHGPSRWDRDHISATARETERPIAKAFAAELEKSKVFECLVCCDDINYRVDSPPAPTCQHDQNVCNGCMKTDFEAKVKTNRIKDLRCPDPKCKQDVPPKRIRELLAGSDAVRIYDKKLALASLSKHEKFRWCKCGGGQIHLPGEASPEWKCAQTSCQRLNCYICKDVDVTDCEHLHAANERRKHEQDVQRKAAQAALVKKQQAKSKAANQEYISKTTKMCPKKGCGVRIGRDGGCSHMTCKNCKTEFCWVCKVIWKNKVPLHLNTCLLAVSRKTMLSGLDKSDYAAGWQDDGKYDASNEGRLWLLDSHK